VVSSLQVFQPRCFIYYSYLPGVRILKRQTLQHLPVLNIILIIQLILRNGVLLEKLKFAQLFNKLTAFYRIGIYIAFFKDSP
jgi:hypothetical protein